MNKTLKTIFIYPDRILRNSQEINRVSKEIRDKLTFSR